METQKYDFKVGEWQVNLSASCIFNDSTETHVEPKAMEVLQLLAEANGEVVSRAAIMEKVWNGRFVTDYALNNVIASLRKYLCADDKDKFIITRPKRGYQLIADVEFNHYQDATDFPSPAITSEVDNTLAKSPQTRPAMNRRIWLMLMCACVIVVVGIISSISPTGSIEDEQTKVKLHTIAVLPFTTDENVSELLYLALGLSNEITSQLSGNNQLRVMDQRSSADVVTRSRDPKQISDLLGVNYVLDGNVYRRDDKTYIDAILYDEFANELWSSSLPADIDSVFTLQDDILLGVQQALNTESLLLTENNNYYRSTNPQAFENLIKGRALNGEATLEAYKQALVHFQMAIEFDPNYASAYVDLAVGYLLLYSQGSISLEQANAQAKPLIDKALALTPMNPSAIAAQGVFAMYNGQTNKAIEYFTLALQQDPELYIARSNLAYVYYTLGDYSSSLEQSLKSLEIHPLAAVPNWQIGKTYFEMGRVKDAVEQLQKCIGFVLNYDDCHLELAFIQALLGQSNAAQQTFSALQKNRDKPENFWLYLNQGFHAWWQGEPQIAQKYYGGLYQKHGIDFSFLPSYAWLRWHLQEHESFLTELENQYQQESRASVYLTRALAILSYAKADCDGMFEYYRQTQALGLTIQSPFSHLIEGHSDLLNQAACHIKAGQAQLADPLLTALEQEIAQADPLSKSAGGITFIEAKIALLRQQNVDISVLEKTLTEQSFAHVWMLEHDWLFSL